MNGKLILALPLLIAGTLALSGPAQAACPVDNPDCGIGGGTTTTSTVHLTVATPSRGSVTGDSGHIACGGTGTDCSQNHTATTTCPDPDSCTTTGDAVTLTASGGGSGYGPHWAGCDSASGSTCSITMDGNHSVSLSWTDDANPSVSLTSPPTKAGPSTVFNSTAADNSGVVTKVDFYVDDVLRATDTSAPYQYVPAPGLSLYADGSTHTLKVVAQDGSGRVSSDLANAPSASFTVDRSTGLTGVTSPAAFTQTAPAVAFTPPGDATSVVCTTKLGGVTVGSSTSGCTSGYTPQMSTDGLYTVEIVVNDNVGNIATITRTFTLDRGAPNLNVTSPANGDVIGGAFTPAVSGTDGFSSVTFDCSLDGGTFGSCASLAPSDGAHTVTVRASDLAGNTSTEQRSFTYDSQAPAVNITGGPAEGSVVFSRSTAFTFTGSDLTAVTYTCSLDDGAFGACTSATGQSLDGLSLGIHTFTVRFVDAAGHSTTVQRRFAVADKPTDSGNSAAVPGATTSSASGTPTSGSAGSTTAPAVKPVTVSTAWRLFGKRTRVDRLTLAGVAKGAKITVTCKGTGCAFKKKTLKGTGKDISLAARFNRRKLGAKTVITVTVAGATGTKRFRYTLRAGKLPKESIR